VTPQPGNRVTPWLLAARPKTLAAAVVPVLVGTALARWSHWPSFLGALGGALFIQIGTNFVNDALDFKKGADTHERLGPLRVTQAGLLSAEAVMRGAIVCFALAALCGVPLIVRGGWPIVVIGVTSIAAAYAYTGGPYPLAYHGLGELFVMVFFGLVAAGGSYYVQRLIVDADALLAGVACGALAIVLLAINNLRDLDNDRASNKRTMAARFGPRFARAEIAVMAAVPFIAAALIAPRRGWAFLGVLVVLPLAALVVVCAMRSEGRALNRCLAFAGMLEWAFGVAFVICGFGAIR
jgi:1,4-dihydroxy-2-naphthoate octaprenyltransferase